MVHGEIRANTHHTFIWKVHQLQSVSYIAVICHETLELTAPCHSVSWGMVVVSHDPKSRQRYSFDIIVEGIPHQVP